MQNIFNKEGEKWLTKKTVHYIVVPTGTTHRKEAGKYAGRWKSFR